MRIYDTAELERLDAKTRGYLLHLEQLGILLPAQRELAIDRLLALDCEEIDIEQVKWVVMMVLFSQPGHEQAYAQMEDLVFAEEPGWMH
jgi:Smg protein